MGQLDTVAGLMLELRGGSADAAGRLVDVLYPELRRLAAAKMARERSDHTWQPTVLVHELYLELTRIKGLPSPGPQGGFSEKAAFLRLAGKIMERRLIDHARPLYRRMPRISIDDAEDLPEGSTGEETLHYIEGLLTGLSGIEPKFRTVVESKVFMGMTLDEIAQQLGCSERTAATYWSFARRWLAKELDQGQVPPGEHVA
jgi:RNA polymerase sigma factor (TIGR02999 family)